MLFLNKNYLPKNKKEKIFVGVSGGVDSSVSLAILKSKGYDVTGVFIKVYHPDFLGCSWAKERDDAKKICLFLGVPFLELDLEKEYKKNIFDYMISEYKKGRTPNPDVFCNKYIKFGAFLNFAEKNGAKYVATGHYAQKKKIKGEFYLTPARDTAKDQTYFLSQINKEQLERAIFPIGGFSKKKVRSLASKYNLFTKNKKDSQGLCFVGKIKMSEFLENFMEKKEGVVLDEKGNNIGKHKGSFFYTIGQRTGFDIFPSFKKPNQDKLFILSKNLKDNTITVGNKEQLDQKNISKDKIYFNDVNSITKEITFYLNKKIFSMVRYRGEKIESILRRDRKGLYVETKKSHNAVSDGQIIAFYTKNGACIGSATI